MSTKQKSYKDLVKQLDQEYRKVAKQAEKEYQTTKQEAERASENERAKIKAKYQKVERAAKDKYVATKESAKEAFVQLTIDTVKNAIMAIKAEAAAAAAAEGASRSNIPLSPQSSSPPPRALSFNFRAESSTTSRSSSSSFALGNAKKENLKAKEDQMVKDLIEFAVDRLEDHLPKKEVRQRLLEEIALMAIAQQHQQQTQQPSTSTTPTLLVGSLPALTRSNPTVPTPIVAVGTQTTDCPPPSYGSIISESDYSAPLDKGKV